MGSCSFCVPSWYLNMISIFGQAKKGHVNYQWLHHTVRIILRTTFAAMEQRTKMYKVLATFKSKIILRYGQRFRW